jgi:hypothetical protein
VLWESWWGCRRWLRRDIEERNQREDLDAHHYGDSVDTARLERLSESLRQFKADVVEVEAVVVGCFRLVGGRFGLAM